MHLCDDVVDVNIDVLVDDVMALVRLSVEFLCGLSVCMMRTSLSRARARARRERERERWRAHYRSYGCGKGRVECFL